MPRLGDLGGSVKILKDMRDQLVENDRRVKIEEERWSSFGTAVSKISLACESRDLEQLVAAARELKNRLRRPSVRKELAKLEATKSSGDEAQKKKKVAPKEKESVPKEKVSAPKSDNFKEKDKVVVPKEKNPVGQCKCDQCGKVIDGSKEPCIDGALCTHCALKNKVIPKHKQKKKKAVVPALAPDVGMEPGGDVERQESFGHLRQRGYLR